MAVNKPILTAKQKRFIELYLVDLNATKAAEDAGYSKKNASHIGWDLLQKPHVIAAIADYRDKLSKSTEITIEKVRRELARIAFFDPRKMFDENGIPKAITELDDDTAAVIAGLEVFEEFEGRGEDRQKVGTIRKWKLSDKKGALDSLGKHLGMFNEKMVHEGGIKIVVEYADAEDHLRDL